MIIETAIKKGVQAASDYWGISEEFANSIMKDYITQDHKELFRTESREIQTNPSSFKEFKEKKSQTKNEHLEAEEYDPKPRKMQKKSEDKRIVAKYTTADKIENVREFVKHQNQSEAARDLGIPTVNLMRWRNKIRNELFQSSHVEQLYKIKKGGVRNKFFKEIDDCIYSWYLLHKDLFQETSQALREKAQKVAKLDDGIPEISEEWLNCFKENYNIQ